MYYNCEHRITVCKSVNEANKLKLKTSIAVRKNTVHQDSELD